MLLQYPAVIKAKRQAIIRTFYSDSNLKVSRDRNGVEFLYKSVKSRYSPCSRLEERLLLVFSPIEGFGFKGSFF